MAVAQAAQATWPCALRHRARRSPEHRVTRVEHQVLGPELRPDRSDQLRQQPDRPSRRANNLKPVAVGAVRVPLAGVHGCTGSSSKTVAVNRTRT
jgi:hypothetical protein